MDETNKPINTNEGPIEEEIIPISIGDRVVRVARSQVWRVEADGDYVWLHTPEQRYLLRESLDRLEERWTGHGFIRIHRSHMVLLPLVTELRRTPSGHNVRLGSGPDAVDVPVSRRNLKEFKHRWIHEHHHSAFALHRPSTVLWPALFW
jgi:two-component system response regulator LytT